MNVLWARSGLLCEWAKKDLRRCLVIMEGYGWAGKKTTVEKIETALFAKWIWEANRAEKGKMSKVINIPVDDIYIIVLGIWLGKSVGLQKVCFGGKSFGSWFTRLFEKIGSIANQFFFK